MLRVGLHPFNVKKSEIMTGETMSHRIMPNGLFEMWCEKLLKGGYTLQWRSRKYTQLPPAGDEDPDPTDGDEAEREEEAAKSKNKRKYTCPGCKSNIWGKPNLDVICGQCSEQYAEQ